MEKVAIHKSEQKTVEVIVADKATEELVWQPVTIRRYRGWIVTRSPETGEVIQRDEYYDSNRNALIERMHKMAETDPDIMADMINKQENE